MFEVLEKYNSEITVGGNIVYDNRNLWMISVNNDMLLKFDLDNKMFIKEYPIPDKRVWYGHYKIAKLNNKIFILPFLGVNIYLFDIIDESIKKVTKESMEQKEEYAIVEAIDKKIVAVEQSQGRIVEIDEANNIIFIDDKLKRALRKQGIEDNVCFSEEYFLLKGKMFLILKESGCFVVFDVMTYEVNVHKLTNNEKIYSVHGNEDYILFTTTKNSIIKWKDGYIIEQIDNDDFFDEQCAFLKPFCTNEVDYLFPWKKRCYYTIKEKQITKYNLDFAIREDSYPVDVYDQFQWIERHEDKTLIQSRINGDIFVIDNLTNEVDVIRLKVPDEKSVEIMKGLMSVKKYVLNEDEVFSLNRFIELV